MARRRASRVNTEGRLEHDAEVAADAELLASEPARLTADDDAALTLDEAGRLADEVRPGNHR